MSIYEVLVNDEKIPTRVELGVSRSFHMVAGAGIDEDPDYFS